MIMFRDLLACRYMYSSLLVVSHVASVAMAAEGLSCYVGRHGERTAPAYRRASRRWVYGAAGAYNGVWTSGSRGCDSLVRG